MALFDLYSKRQKKLKGELPDVYTYETLPSELKVQIIHIWHETLGSKSDYHYNRGHVVQVYAYIVGALRKEYGVFDLDDGQRHSDTFLSELIKFFLAENDIERQLDVIELTFNKIDKSTRSFEYLHKRNSIQLADIALDELNQRFKEHGVGYQFSNSKIIRIDTEFTHAEIVKPALGLLNKKEFAGAQEEFLAAHEHYRNGKHKEALNECLKSFESAMKAICDKRMWEYDSKKSTAKDLIRICFENELVPKFWETKFSSLRSLLESSVPTGRNKLSGHGQGSKPKKVPDYITSYMINMTASTLVFLLKADEELKPKDEK